MVNKGFDWIVPVILKAQWTVVNDVEHKRYFWPLGSIETPSARCGCLIALSLLSSSSGYNHLLQWGPMVTRTASVAVESRVLFGGSNWNFEILKFQNSKIQKFESSMQMKAIEWRPPDGWCSRLLEFVARSIPWNERIEIQSKIQFKIQIQTSRFERKLSRRFLLSIRVTRLVESAQRIWSNEQIRKARAPNRRDR